MPDGPGWYVVNVADAPAVTHERTGGWIQLERPDSPFDSVGVNIRVLEPGQTTGLYHAESVEEHFLVLSGLVLALVGGVERALGAWDFLHVPPGISHTFVGGGDGPSSILMMGARHPERRTFYPQSDLAARHGASAAADTESAPQAYAVWGDLAFEDLRPEWPPR